MTPEQKRERISGLAGLQYLENKAPLPEGVEAMIVCKTCNVGIHSSHIAGMPDLNCGRHHDLRIMGAGVVINGEVTDVPDYDTSLDALRSVLAGLSDEQHCHFRRKLDQLICRDPKTDFWRAYVMPDPAVAVDALLLALC